MTDRALVRSTCNYVLTDRRKFLTEIGDQSSQIRALYLTLTVVDWSTLAQLIWVVCEGVEPG